MVREPRPRRCRKRPHTELSWQSTQLPQGLGASTEKYEVAKSLSPLLSLPSVCPLKEGSKSFWVMRHSGTISKRTPPPKKKLGMNQGEGQTMKWLSVSCRQKQEGGRNTDKCVLLCKSNHLQEFSWGCWEKITTAGLVDFPS